METQNLWTGSHETTDLLARLFIVEQAAKKTFGAEKDFGVGGEVGYSNIVCRRAIFALPGFGGI